MRAPLAATLLGLVALAPSAADDSLAPIIEIVALSDDPEVQADLLQGVRDGLRGMTSVAPPEGWAELYAKLKKGGDPRVLALADSLARVFGDTEIWVKTLAKLRDTGAPADERVAALRDLVEQRHPEASGELRELIGDRALRLEAIRSMAAIEVRGATKLLIGRYATFTAEEKLAAVQTLGSRRAYAWSFGHAIKDGRIPREDVPAYVRRQVVGFVGRGSIPQIDDVPELPEDKARLIATWKKRLGEDSLAKADLGNGRLVYERTCAVCHKLFDTGGAVGPDLTGSNRADLDYILDNIVNPSGDVAEAYKLVVFQMKDGRVVAGNVVEENDTQVVVRTVVEQITLAKAEIEKRQTAAVSLMPDGLLATLKEHEVRDMIAYLRSPEQVPKGDAPPRR